MAINIDSKTAELAGAHIGDGTLYKTGKCIVWELRGDLLEKGYYLNNIVPLLYSILQIEFKPKFRSGGKNGCFGIQTSNKQLTQLMVDLGFRPRRKTHTVSIPDYIKNSTDEIKRSFVRGLFDTDGCLRFDKNRSPRNYYPKMEFASVSKELIPDLSIILNELGFRNHTWKDGISSKLCVAGKEMLYRWMEEIQPHNPKHLYKYDIFSKLGHVPTNAAMAQSGTAQIRSLKKKL